MGETRAGLRRYGDTDRGGHYQTTLAHYGTGPSDVPPPHERTFGDLISPARPGRAVDLVNAVTRDIRSDAAGWGIDRILGMVALMAEEGNGTQERRARDELLDG